MADELVHASVGTALSQAEWEDVNGHACNNSTQGDILYISSSGAIKRLAAGTAGYALITGGAAANPSWGPGAPSTWAPTITQGAAVAVTVNFATYYKIGRLLFTEIQLTMTGTGQSTQPIQVSIPAAIAPANFGATVVIGSANIQRTGTVEYACNAYATSTAVIQFLFSSSVGGYVGQVPSFGLAATDIVNLNARWVCT